MTARSCVTISRYHSTRTNSSLAFTLIWRCSWKEGRIGTLCRKAFDEVERLTHITTVICCYYKQPGVPSSRQKNQLSFRNGILDPRYVVSLLCLLYFSFVMPCTRFFDGDSERNTLFSMLLIRSIWMKLCLEQIREANIKLSCEVCTRCSGRRHYFNA